jgi:hypothetical protein
VDRAWPSTDRRLGTVQWLPSRQRGVMTRPHPGLVRISSPADLIALVPRLLGFVPRESVVVICLHGLRRRVGLAMRFDLADAVDPARFAAMVHERITMDAAASAFVVVFSARLPSDGASPRDDLPHAAAAAALVDQIGSVIADVVLTDGARWWSYGCDDACCGGPGGVLIDPSTPGAMAVAAAYALVGQGVLPDREAVVRSVALQLDEAESVEANGSINVHVALYEDIAQSERRVKVRGLAERLMVRLTDPRAVITSSEVADFAALCADPIVRDEVLVRAADSASRDRLLPVLREMVRRVPPPLDAPLCAMLAWTAYADGDGVVANVAVERALATDPRYSLAGLIADALFRQVPPHLLEAVMRGAALDLGCGRDLTEDYGAG